MFVVLIVDKAHEVYRICRRTERRELVHLDSFTSIFVEARLQL